MTSPAVAAMSAMFTWLLVYYAHTVLTKGTTMVTIGVNTCETSTEMLPGLLLHLKHLLLHPLLLLPLLELPANCHPLPQFQHHYHHQYWLPLTKKNLWQTPFLTCLNKKILLLLNRPVLPRNGCSPLKTSKRTQSGRSNVLPGKNFQRMR